MVHLVLGVRHSPPYAKINKAIWCMMGGEVAWGDPFTDVMGCSSVKARGIYNIRWENPAR